jgi:hypothetical protein
MPRELKLLEILGMAPMKKSEPVTKMALGDIKPGRDMGTTHNIHSPMGLFERVDYTYLLKPEHQKAGYKMLLEHKSVPSDTGGMGKIMRAVITHPEASKNRNTTMNPGEAAQVTATLHPDGHMVIGASDSDPDHRGGKGVPLYEALLGHAKNVFGAKSVSGDIHSTLAQRVHAKLAEKHGLDYRPEINPRHVTDPSGPHDQKFQPYGYALKAEVWLAQHRLTKAIKPGDLKPVARYHDGPLGETFVDHSKEFEAHPPEHEAHVGAFRSAVIEHPDPVKRGKTGTRESSNSTGKVVYDVNDHWIGDQREHRFMVKPYHEKIVPKARSWMHFPIQGWAEMTNQALYHAGQIGDLHQKVHVAEVPMPATALAKRRPTLAQYKKTPDAKIDWDMLMAGKIKGDEGWVPHKTYAEFLNEHDQGAINPDTESEPTKAPALVIHMQPDVDAVRFLRSDDFTPEERMGAKKIGLFDFLTNNLDRHHDNLLWDNSNNRFLAIDHSRSFQYKGPDKGFGLSPAEKRERTHIGTEDRLSHYIGGTSAIRKVDSKPNPAGYGNNGSNKEEAEKAHLRDADLWNEEWNDTMNWWLKVAPAVRKTMDERLNMIKDTNVRNHIKKNFDVRAAHLDDFAKHGVENFGRLDWDRTPVSIFPYK